MRILSLLLLTAGTFTICGFAAEQTWTGKISDSSCGASHKKMAEHGKSAMSGRDCTLACVKGGGKYVFVEGGKVYYVENQDAAGLQEHAGHTVRLTGEMNGDSIKVSKIEMGAAGPTRRRRTSLRSGLSSFARTGASGASAPDCGCAAEHLL